MYNTPIEINGYSRDGHVHALLSSLRSVISDMRAENVDGKLKSRALSVAITECETAYLFLNELTDNNRLNF